MDIKHRIVVLDDDPTGIQTVHGCLVLTTWDKEALAHAFEDKSGLFYILTNTRARPASEVRAVIDAIMDNLLSLQQEQGYTCTLVSRSDSTLRSHFPLEIDGIRSALVQRNMPAVDAVFVIPAFFEGARITLDDTHYIVENGVHIPTAQTEFARDSVFGYTTSHLPSYIEEKTAGAVSAHSVKSVSLDMLGDGKGLEAFLNSLEGGTYVAVNAQSYDDLDRFSQSIRKAIGDGKNFLFQSAASWVKSLALVSDKPLLTGKSLGTGGRGLVIVGSHVHKTTLQLRHLLAHVQTIGIEAQVDAIIDSYDTHLATVNNWMLEAWQTGQIPVVFTSRAERTASNADERLKLGATVASFLVDIVRCAPLPLAWCIAKGGITSHTILQEGLDVTQARVLGQILPGVPVVRVPSPGQFAGLTYVIFPGNVGDETALRTAFDKLSESTSATSS
ncbi:four-carbon acid sugar kinase family protein [Planctomycetota bacterium]